MSDEDISFNDLIASSIHDMKNSLNMQVSVLETIATQCRQQGDQPTFDSLGHVIYQASRMNANLIQLLSLYKLGKSIYPVDIAEQSVRHLIDDVLLQNQSIMEFKGIALTVDCDDDCQWYFDRDLVTGVLTNALNNAYNYTHDKIRIVARVDSGYLELRIEDNGRGFPASMLISGADSVSKRSRFDSGSTGLGVYFSSQVAHVHKNGNLHGTVTMENGGAYGGGCFVLRLP